MKSIKFLNTVYHQLEINERRKIRATTFVVSEKIARMSHHKAFKISL